MNIMNIILSKIISIARSQKECYLKLLNALIGNKKKLWLNFPFSKLVPNVLTLTKKKKKGNFQNSKCISKVFINILLNDYLLR